MSHEIEKPVVIGDSYITPSVQQHLDKWKVTAAGDAPALSDAATERTEPVVETGTGMISPIVERHLRRFGGSAPKSAAEA